MHGPQPDQPLLRAQAPLITDEPSGTQRVGGQDDPRQGRSGMDLREGLCEDEVCVPSPDGAGLQAGLSVGRLSGCIRLAVPITCIC